MATGNEVGIFAKDEEDIMVALETKNRARIEKKKKKKDKFAKRSQRTTRAKKNKLGVLPFPK